MLPDTFGHNNNGNGNSSQCFDASQHVNLETGASSGAMQRSDMFAMQGYKQITRLFDSPPETASGGSGSPLSRSDVSPFPCRFDQNYYGYGLQDSFFKANQPIIRHQHTPGPESTHEKNPTFGPENHESTIAFLRNCQQHSSSQQLLSSEREDLGYPHNQIPACTHDAWTALPSATPHSPFLNIPGPSASSIEAHGSLPRKRSRPESGQSGSFQKTDPSSPWTSVEDLNDGDGPQDRSIQFHQFQSETFNSLYDQHHRELQRLGFHVAADKGFKYSTFDSSFVAQRKNHLQITVHIEAPDPMPAKFMRVQSELKPIKEFSLDFSGVVMEKHGSFIQIKQTNRDRKPVPYESVKFDIPPQRRTKVTVGRLHFSETTTNNQRKNGKPNPHQKYFLLVVSLNAITEDAEQHRVQCCASEKAIVRGCNPAQFDRGDWDDWQRVPGENVIFHTGCVCIGTDRPIGEGGATLNVAGGIQYTGSLLHSCDRRVKENISEVDASVALSRMSQIRIVHYDIRPELAEEWGLSEQERLKRIGVLAQELREVMPEAVKEDGEYLQVDDTRLFYESAVAVKELCRLTGNLEEKIDEVEKLKQNLAKIAKLKRLDSLRSASSGPSSGASSHSQDLSISRNSMTTVSPTLTCKQSACKVNNLTEPMKNVSSQTSQILPPFYCDGHDMGFCSKKIIQTAIIVLVVIMALWLPTPVPRHPPGDVLPIMPTEPTETTKHSQKPPGKMFKTNEARLLPPDLNAPDWIGVFHKPVPPSLYPCFSNTCQQYCCQDRLRYESGKTPGRTAREMVFAKREKLEFEDKTRAEELFVSVQKTDRVGAAKIVILGLNISVDERYSVRPSSSSYVRNGGNFTFYIPVSRNMPHIPLDIEFEVESAEMTVEFCAQKAMEYCVADEDEFRFLGGAGQKQVEKINSNHFQLPVGFYVQSAYRFRIGMSTTSCSQVAGELFEEYNLVFYRTCLTQNSQ